MLNFRNFFCYSPLAAILLLPGLLLLPGRVAAQPALPQGAEAAAGEAQVLERGPVHEAFAEPFAVDPAGEAAESLVVAKQPPDLIDEIPPEVRPEGDNVQWIPGYWMWSVEQEDFIWISGIWRNFPPGRQWVSGYWEEVDGGFRWVSGFWQQVDAAEPAFLPEPPESLEVGPNQPAPTVEHFWIPGCWTWRTTQYVWRPGYWYQGQANWVWIPHRYVWTPRGFLFIRGYWDFPLARRGLLYAPVYWARPLVAWRHLHYTPRYVVNVNLLLGNLFVHPIHRHYYFGHYDRAFRHRYGLTPWFDVHPHRHGGLRSYDPLLAYHHWQHHRQNPRWLDDMRADFDRRHDHPHGDVRGGGPRGNADEPNRRGQRDLVRSVGEYVRDPETAVRVTRLSNPQIQEAREAARRRVGEKHLAGRQVVPGPQQAAPNVTARGNGRQQATTRAKVTFPGNAQGNQGDTPTVDPRVNSRQQQLDARWDARQRALRAQAESGAAAEALERRRSSVRPEATVDPRYQQYRERRQQATRQLQSDAAQRIQTGRGNASRFQQDAVPWGQFRGRGTPSQSPQQLRSSPSRSSNRSSATLGPAPVERRSVQRSQSRATQVTPFQGRSSNNAGRGSSAARGQFRGNLGRGHSKARGNR